MKNMRRPCFIIVLVICVVNCTKHDISNNNNAKSSPGKQVYQVITRDGYKLQVHRLTRSPGLLSKKYPVLLIHGLYQSSDGYLALGREKSLPYNLLDAGFDVWLGNLRGNRYSRSHIHLKPDDPKQKFQFFNHSYEEIALNDLPIIIDYILQKTKRNKLHYVGHSLGGAELFVLNSLKPKYNRKIVKAHLLAAVGYQEYFPDSAISALAYINGPIYSLLRKLGIVEIFPSNHTIAPNISKTGDFINMEDNCLGDVNFRQLCRTVKIGKIMGFNAHTKNMGGGSLKQLVHLAQNIKSKRFSRWDYGSVSNLQTYGTPVPPNYNLSLVSVSTTLHYSINDEYIHERDVINVAKDLQNAVVRKVGRSNFTHSDFISASDAKQLVYDHIVEDLIFQEFNEGESTTEEDEPNLASTLSVCVVLKLFILMLGTKLLL